ncbi:MAG: hypothetical protein HQK83_19080 [Fibrobacteria bacterium]|nr:hypothetical protein [Fibrobacteria bacterium]
MMFQVVNGKVTRQFISTLLLVCGIYAQDKVELLSVKRIWGSAPHQAFTDLIRFKGKFFCTFREASAHEAFDGKLRIIVSFDGNSWESVALLNSPSGTDLRDGKLSITPDNRLMLTCGDRSSSGFLSYVAYSEDGVQWGSLILIGQANEWLWRSTWHGDTVYSVGYSTNSENWYLRLYKSGDDSNFIAVDTMYKTGVMINESTMLFLENDTAYCLSRTDSDVQHALLGISSPPYTSWDWKDLGLYLGGPDMILLPDGRFIAAGRYRGTATSGWGVTALLLLDPVQGKLTHLLSLPSSGDGSYPGLLWYDGLLWVSYYASHEGKTMIYLAKVRTSPDTSSSAMLSWAFDESEGTNVADASGNERDGIFHNTGFSDGKYNGAFVFNGTNAYVSSDSAVLLPSSITFACWVKLQAKTGDWKNNQGLVSNYSTSGYILEANPEGTGLLFYDGDWLSVSGNVTDGWHHVAATRNYFTGEKNIYLDGELLGSKAVGTMGTAGTIIRVGYTGDNQRFTKGLIDEVNVFDRPLSKAEIGLLMDNSFLNRLYIKDSTNVKLILDANNYKGTVESVSDTDSSGRIVSLNLSLLALTVLPPEIGMLDAVVSLNLDSNTLSSLPAEITLLNPSAGLSLQANALCEVPDSINAWIEKYSADSSWQNMQNCEVGVQDKMNMLKQPVVHIAGNKITIRFKDDFKKDFVRIFNPGGTIVAEFFEVTGKSFSFNAEKLEKGIYFLQFRHSGKVFLGIVPLF